MLKREIYITIGILVVFIIVGVLLFFIVKRILKKRVKKGFSDE